MNPCPCGHHSHDPARRQRCNCSRHARQQYIRKVSGPLLDRIDIHLRIEGVPARDLISSSGTFEPARHASRLERARQWRDRVIRARRKQVERNPEGVTNHRLEGQALHDAVRLGREGQFLLERSMDRFGFSARTHTRILRMARTMADMEDREQVITEDIAGAIALRRAGSAVPSPTDEGAWDSPLFGG